MKIIFILIFHALRAMLKFLQTNGANSLVADNLALRQQLIVTNRQHKRLPNLTMWERLSFAFMAALIHPKRLFKTGILIKPATLLKLHHALVKKKYSKLFSRKSHHKPGPKGLRCRQFFQVIYL